jgi:hypothetical protein
MNSAVFRLLLLMVLWGSAAASAGAFRLLVHLPPATVPLLIAGPAIVLSIASLRPGWVRAAVHTLDVKVVISAHLVRFVGLYFLWLHGEGRMPAAFALPAGWGDVAVAAGALLLLVPRREGRIFPGALLAWNVLGFADLLFAAGTGAWLNLTRPGSMIAMSSLPLTLVPLWLVPVLLASHVHLFHRIRGWREAPRGVAVAP